MTHVRAERLTKHYPLSGGGDRRAVRAVEEVSLAIARGEVLGLVGESGSGKSTLGRLLLALIPPTAGRAFVGDREVTSLRGEALRRERRRMQMIFQDPYGSLDPRQTAGDAVAEPLAIHEPARSRAERREIAAALLARVGLPADAAGRLPVAFSGGQRQRIAIARALAPSPEFVVADEPVSALDRRVQEQVLDLLLGLRDERRLTLLFVSHDLRVVERVADRVAVIYLGRIVEERPRESFFREPLHPYSRALLSAVPGSGHERIVLDGEPPSPARPPTGCAFHPRCPLRARLSPEERRRCEDETPALIAIGGAVGLVACHHAAR